MPCAHMFYSGYIDTAVVSVPYYGGAAVYTVACNVCPCTVVHAVRLSYHPPPAAAEQPHRFNVGGNIGRLGSMASLGLLGFRLASIFLGGGDIGW